MHKITTRRAYKKLKKRISSIIYGEMSAEQELEAERIDRERGSTW
jgi:hypothetical protein